MAGASGVVAGPLLVSVATSISRMPPDAGAGNSCDSRRSPSTSAVALTVAPASRSLNCARPFSSVFCVSVLEPTCSSTLCPGMLFDRDPRIRRTEIAPLGRSSTGRGMPDICFGSGIAKPPCWARATAEPTPRTPRTQRIRIPASRRQRNLCVLRVHCGESAADERLAAGFTETRVLIVPCVARLALTLG